MTLFIKMRLFNHGVHFFLLLTIFQPSFGRRREDTASSIDTELFDSQNDPVLYKTILPQRRNSKRLILPDFDETDNKLNKITENKNEDKISTYRDDIPESIKLKQRKNSKETKIESEMKVEKDRKRIGEREKNSQQEKSKGKIRKESNKQQNNENKKLKKERNNMTKIVEEEKEEEEEEEEEETIKNDVSEKITSPTKENRFNIELFDKIIGDNDSGEVDIMSSAETTMTPALESSVVIVEDDNTGERKLKNKTRRKKNKKTKKRNKRKRFQLDGDGESLDNAINEEMEAIMPFCIQSPNCRNTDLCSNSGDCMQCNRQSRTLIRLKRSKSPKPTPSRSNLISFNQPHFHINQNDSTNDLDPNNEKLVKKAGHKHKLIKKKILQVWKNKLQLPTRTSMENCCHCCCPKVNTRQPSIWDLWFRNGLRAEGGFADNDNDNDTGNGTGFGAGRPVDHSQQQQQQQNGFGFLPLPMFSPNMFQQQAAPPPPMIEIPDFHNMVLSPLVLPDGELRFFGGEHGVQVPYVTDWLQEPLAIGLNSLTNSLFGQMRSTVRTMGSYVSAAGSSLFLDRIFGRSVVVTNATRSLASDNANFLDSALRVVQQHDSFFSGTNKKK